MSPINVSAEPRSVYELTLGDIEALRAAGCDTVIVPMGQIAQHGRHLPLASDVIQAQELSRRIVRRLDQDGLSMLLGPTIPFGHSPTHHRFAGTVELEPETLALVIRDIGRSLLRQGFERIVLLCCGGGNWAAVENAAYHLWSKDGAKTWVLGYFEIMAAAAAEHLDAPGRGEHDGHAAELETSCVLAAAPQLVDMSKAINHQSAEYRELMALPMRAVNFNELARATGNWDMRAFGADGVWGNATLASAEKGEKILSSAADLLAEHVKRYVYGVRSPDTA
jgi:creatinine amidohydrolase